MTSIKCEKGATLVEFVLVLPLLLILTFAIIEFGLLMYNKAVITNASREGARAGIVYRPNADFFEKADIETVINRYLASNGGTSRLITFGNTSTAMEIYNIQWSTSGINNPTEWHDPMQDNDAYLKVSLRYRYNFLILPNFTGLGNDIPLEGETIMRIENPLASS